MAEPEGLLAVGGDLSEARLLLAYRMGIFPWYSEGEPILWWSPDPRLVIFPEKLHRSRSLRKVLGKKEFRVSFDTAFDAVITACAEAPRPGQDGTWITRAMVKAYKGLHRSGHAHSIECWRGEELVGGLYGLLLGQCFSGESMFSRAPNASKVALVHLADLAQDWAFSVIDCQVPSDHLKTLGAEEISRREFLQLL
jgi:leucyl/phenylalanyl-tRNA---protein transferase